MPSVQPCALVLAAVNCRKERDESMRSKAGKIRPFSRGRAASVVVRSGLGSRVSRTGRVAVAVGVVWCVDVERPTAVLCVCAPSFQDLIFFYFSWQDGGARGEGRGRARAAQPSLREALVSRLGAVRDGVCQSGVLSNVKSSL